MKLNKTIRIGGAIFLVGLAENILLLLLFGLGITQQVLIGTAIFTLVLTFVLEKLGLTKEC